ncbi:MAG: peptidoglycan-associated lipoprotein Pal [Syntrophales bacterium]|jgi:peptidoglycan-associated lipoprotein
MKRSLAIVGIIGLIVCFSFVVLTGCAKKSAVKEQSVSAEDKAAADRAAEQAKAQADADAKARAEQEARLAAERQAKEEAEAKVAPQAEAAAAKEEMTFKDVLFDFDKYNLKPEGRDILKQLAEWLINNKNTSVLIEGNCDERGTTEYNLALGERRAKEAMKYLVELGVEGKRIKTISYGKERPLDPGHTEEAWAKNRRDHVVVTTK